MTSRACSSLTSFMAASRSRAGAPSRSMAIERRKFSSSDWRSSHEYTFDSKVRKGLQMVGDMENPCGEFRGEGRK